MTELQFINDIIDMTLPGDVSKQLVLIVVYGHWSIITSLHYIVWPTQPFEKSMANMARDNKINREVGEGLVLPIDIKKTPFF